MHTSVHARTYLYVNIRSFRAGNAALSEESANGMRMYCARIHTHTCIHAHTLKFTYIRLHKYTSICKYTHSLIRKYSEFFMRVMPHFAGSLLRECALIIST